MRVAFSLVVGCLALCAFGAMHCGGSKATGAEGLEPPKVHRATAEACDATRRHGLTFDGGADVVATHQCTNDSDCTAGKNGRCAPSGMVADTSACSYDACTTDDECASGSACKCAYNVNEPGPGPSLRGPHLCVPSGCRTDSDCGPGGFCSPTLEISCAVPTNFAGYYCHTSNDECTNDSQCTSGPVTPGYCAYEKDKGRWACHYGYCSG